MSDRKHLLDAMTGAGVVGGPGWAKGLVDAAIREGIGAYKAELRAKILFIADGSGNAYFVTRGKERIEMVPLVAVLTLVTDKPSLESPKPGTPPAPPSGFTSGRHG